MWPNKSPVVQNFFIASIFVSWAFKQHLTKFKRVQIDLRHIESKSVLVTNWRQYPIWWSMPDFAPESFCTTRTSKLVPLYSFPDLKLETFQTEDWNYQWMWMLKVKVSLIEVRFPLWGWWGEHVLSKDPFASSKTKTGQIRIPKNWLLIV